MRRTVGPLAGAVVGIVLACGGFGTFGTASANATTFAPSVQTAFGASQITLHASTTFTFTITNVNSATPFTGVAFTDTLPANLAVGTPVNGSNTCGGTASATAGSGTITLSGGSIASASHCTISLNVTGTGTGVANNSVVVTSDQGTANAANASIAIVGPPTPIVMFGAQTIPLGASTSMTFTIQNPNATTLSGVGITDTLPVGLKLATPVDLTGSCGGGTIGALAGGTTVSLSGATLAAGASCTFSVNVTSIAAGSQTNTTGQVSSTQGGEGATATATLTVLAAPSLSATFSPSAILPGATTQLAFTITNPSANPLTLTGVSLLDTLPAGLTITSATSSACNGVLTTNAATRTISLGGAAVSAQGSCQFVVTVTASTDGRYVDTAGPISSTNGGTGNSTATALSVANPPAISEAFSAAHIQQGGTATLTYTLSNTRNTTVALTGLAFEDNLPSDLRVAAAPATANTCGGTVAAAGGGVSLIGGSLAAAASCTVGLTVQGVSAGAQDNPVGVTATGGPAGNTAHASITVIAPPQLSLTLSPASVRAGGHTTLTITVTNPNAATDLTAVGFTSSLPKGVAVAKPSHATGSCSGTGLKASAGTVSLSKATVPAGTHCTLTVALTASASGSLRLTSGPVSSAEGGEGVAAGATLKVHASFAVSHVHGTRFEVTVPSAGTITARETSGFTVATGSARAKHAGTLHMRLKLTARGRRLFRGHKVTLRVTFTPTHGKPRTRTVRGIVFAA